MGLPINHYGVRPRLYPLTTHFSKAKWAMQHRSALTSGETGRVGHDTAGSNEGNWVTILSKQVRAMD